MNRDDYIEHLRARLKAAEEVIHKTTKQDPVGWQFLENGEWHQGGLFNNHRRNTEEAGYPVRDVYAGPVLNTVEVAPAVKPPIEKALNDAFITGLGAMVVHVPTEELYTKAKPAFELGDSVRKTKGSKWKGRVVGTYSTALTPEGYAVESSTETGSVQIYPAAALELFEEDKDE